jgi:cysteine desulfurase/selenocysteine lyase
MSEWWEDLRSHFPLLERRAYFFAGAQSPLAGEVRAAILDFLDLWEDRIWRFEQTEWRSFDDASRTLGAIVGCDPSRVIAAEGTSHALNLATAMVLADWARSGSPARNVVLHDDSHPASSYAWLNAVRLGGALELRWPRREPGQAPDAAVASAIDENTLAVVTTHVSHVTGERLDALALARAFPQRSFALLLDAAQTAGALPLQEEVDACDFVAMPSYKWLFGPPGVGFLVAGAAWLEDVGPPFVGWASVKDVMAMDPARMDLSPGGTAFRLGIPNFIGMAGAAAGLAIWERAGGARIAERIEMLTDQLMTGIARLGHSSPTPSQWPRRAGVVTIDLPDAEAVMIDFLREGVEVGVEVGRLRVDPHAYNTVDEIDRLLDLLSAVPRVSA